MTKNTVLYPPLETGSDSIEDKNMLLSNELKRSFDTVCHIHHVQKRIKAKEDRGTNNNNNNNNDSKSSMMDDDDMDDKTSIVIENQKQDLDARKFEAAVAAAVAAESEISSLMNGIHELENILLHQESSEEMIQSEKFPALSSQYDGGSKMNHVQEEDDDDQNDDHDR